MPSPSASTASPPPTTQTGHGGGTSWRTRTANPSSLAGGWAPARPSISPPRRPRSGGASRRNGSCGSAFRASKLTTARATTCRRRCASATAARGPRPPGASGFSNWSHDVGGYLGERLVSRCPRELLLRWAWFGCFTPLMQAHGRFPQEAWTYDPAALEIYRAAVMLHERLVPYVRAAAATAARTGLPIVRPLPLTDPADERGWTLSDQYGYGPALWVAPVLEDGAREREVSLPRGVWIDLWTGEHHTGGGELLAAAPVERIPVYVRSGSILVTYPAEHVAEGLGDRPERDRPLEATLYGEPSAGRKGARLVDGTRIRWHEGEWSVEPERSIRFGTAPLP